MDPVIKAINKAIDNYNKKFGPDAISKIEPLFDPLHPDEFLDQEGIDKLNEAVKSGKPLPEWHEPKDILY